jgi:predicted O-methyltransferase YrrM
VDSTLNRRLQPARQHEAQRPTGAVPTLDDVPIRVIGESADRFSVGVVGDAVELTPRGPIPRRCTIRPAALFTHPCGFPDVNTVMGRIVFSRGDVEPRRYRPFTGDPDRNLRELFFPIETMPDDDWPASAERWSNWQRVARCLLTAARVPWDGLSARDVAELVDFVPWPEPLEGCLLHALAQSAARLGGCVIEIGSWRGRSTTMLAMALRGANSDALLISIDPHATHPHNLEHVRLALRQIGEEDRLVQLKMPSDRASRFLRPGSASFIFVDGNHEYDQVVADFEHYRELLAPGGCMLFHDYGYGPHNGLPEADPDVRRAVDDHVLTARDFRPLLLAHTQFAFLRYLPERL